jgi:D-3-phosphoglycerate dehydrogenase
VGVVDCSYDMTKEELLAKISLVDAIVIRSATKVGDQLAAAAPGCAEVARGG